MCCQGAWDSSDVVVFKQFGGAKRKVVCPILNSTNTTTMGGDHKCPVCQATFTRPQHVARHMRSRKSGSPPAPPTILTLHRHRRQAVQVPVLWRSICQKVCVLDFWIVSGVRISAPRDLLVGPTVGRMSRLLNQSV